MSQHPARTNPSPLPLLTIGGADSGGAAGIQADLRAWAQLGAYGMSALTVVTAQNSIAVTAAHFLPPSFLAAQLDAVLADYGAVGIKTGFIGQAALVETIAGRLRGVDAPLVVDPVLVNHRAAAMFPEAVTAAYRELLLPQAAAVTPNRHEAALLTGLPVTNQAEATAAAQALHDMGARGVLIKGLTAAAGLVDLWYDGQAITPIPHPVIPTANTHGSGDTLSAVLCAGLAAGLEPFTAVTEAIRFTQQAIRHGAGWQLGGGHGPVGWGQP